jgi:HEAT repeat protein
MTAAPAAAGLTSPDPLERAAAAAALGATRTRARAGTVLALRRCALEDPDPRVRAAALAALVRVTARADAAAVWRQLAHDDDPVVRRRCAQLAPTLGRAVPVTGLVDLLHDSDVWVAEAAAFAIGEHPTAGPRAVHALMEAAVSHPDPLVREASVAALGAVGAPAALPAVLAASRDRPAIRRRAVLALAAFDGPEVEQRLREALDDTDWQTRQAAEDLVAAGGPSPAEPATPSEPADPASRAGRSGP